MNMPDSDYSGREVLMLCKRACGRTTTGVLKRSAHGAKRNPNPAPGSQDNRFLGHVAVCTVCGGEATDNYKWEWK